MANMRSWAVGVALVILTMPGGGCSSTVAAPTGPTTQRVIGIEVWTADTAFEPLSDVRVEILNGPRPGENATTAGGRAVFSGPYSGMLQFRATKDGFAAATGMLDLDRARNQTVTLGLNLQPAGPTANLEDGSYSLTFVAAPACTTLPPALRTRRYDATVTVSPRSGIYSVEPSGEYLNPSRPSFNLGIAGTSARFEHDGGFGERLPPFVYFDRVGSGAATVEPATVSRIEMKYAGTFRYCSLRAARDRGCTQAPADQVIERGECTSQDHRVILERR